MRSIALIVCVAVAALALGSFVALRVIGNSDGVLWSGLGLLVLAGFLWFWDFERDAAFVDDWVEAGQIAGCLASALAGFVLLVVYLVA